MTDDAWLEYSNKQMQIHFLWITPEVETHIPIYVVLVLVFIVYLSKYNRQKKIYKCGWSYRREYFKEYNQSVLITAV